MSLIRLFRAAMVISSVPDRPEGAERKMSANVAGADLSHIMVAPCRFAPVSIDARMNDGQDRFFSTHARSDACGS
jgi:hypothetical protein